MRITLFPIILLGLCVPVFAQEVQDAEPVEPAAEISVETPAVEVETELRPNILDVEGADEMVEAIESFGSALQPDSESGEPVEALDLSVREAVRRTLERNPQVVVAEADAAAAQARVGQARSQILPQAKYRVVHIWDDRTDYSSASSGGGLGGLSSLGGLGGVGGGIGSVGGLGSLGGLGGGGGGAGAALSIGSGVLQQVIQRGLAEDYLPDDQIWTQTLTITQVIYAGGRISAAVEGARHAAEAEEWRRAAKLDELEFLTKQAYYDCLLARALMRVSEESVQTFERNLSDAQDMFEVGMISSFEVLRAKTELGSRQADLSTSKNLLRLNLANLRRLIGVPHGTPLVLEAHLDWFPYVAPVEDLVDQAYEFRPEIQALEEAVLAARQELRGVKGSYKPNVAASAEYQTVDGAPTVSDGWIVSVAAEWEIAAGGRRRHERAESKSNIRGAEAQLEDLKQIVELEVTQARIQIEDAIAKATAERGNVELAREGLRLAELRFQEGVGTQSETLDAELALTRAETSLVQALRDFAVANAQLEKAIGKSWFRAREANDVDMNVVAAE